MTEPLLAVRDLRAGYGGKPVLQGVNLEIQAGEIIAVIGRNGVGKSTLMRTLIGLLPTMAGDLQLDGRGIGSLTPHLRARAGIGYVPQGRDVFPRLTVEENLRVAESMQGARRSSGRSSGRSATASEYERVYTYFPILRERRKQRAGTLSGGQQQQLAIGRVLIGRPSLLLLDEPSEGIQPSVVQDIARIIVSLNRDTGITVLLVEQNLDMIQAMAQRCYVMDKGRITAELAATDHHDRATMRRHLAV